MNTAAARLHRHPPAACSTSDNGWVRDHRHLQEQRQRGLSRAGLMTAARMNFGVHRVQRSDPKRQRQQVGRRGVAVDGRNRSLEWFAGGAGRRSCRRSPPSRTTATCTANVTLAIPAGKEMALAAPPHDRRHRPDAGDEVGAGIKESKLLSSTCRRQLRKLHRQLGRGQPVHRRRRHRAPPRRRVRRRRDSAPATSSAARSRSRRYKLATFYGPVELPADKVIAPDQRRRVRGRGNWS